MGVRLGMRKVWIGVMVGSGVYVFRGVAVEVTVGVNVGIAAAVWTEAASAVCAIRTLIAFGSSGGMGVGVARDGTQPRISVRIVDQINSFILDKVMLPFTPSRTEIRINQDLPSTRAHEPDTPFLKMAR